MVPAEYDKWSGSPLDRIRPSDPSGGRAWIELPALRSGDYLFPSRLRACRILSTRPCAVLGMAELRRSPRFAWVSDALDETAIYAVLVC